jgi:hypothetical protein
MFTIKGIWNEGRKETGEGRGNGDLCYCGKLEFFSIDRVANVCYINDTFVCLSALVNIFITFKTSSSS